MVVRQRRNLILAQSVLRLIQSLDGYLVSWPLQEVSGDVAYANNPANGAIKASSQFPGADVVINGDFDTDTDWTKDAAVTIASGKATWDGTQVANADLTATVAPLTNGIRYQVTIVTSGISAGTVTPILGTQAGTARSANGEFTEEFTANGTALILRGDSDFTGSVESIVVRPANPLNGDYNNVTVGQSGNSRVPYNTAGYNGTTSYTNAYSSELDILFDPTQGTLLALIEITDSNVWTDGIARFAAFFGADQTANFAYISKSATHNRIDLVYEAGNIVKLITLSSQTFTGRRLLTLTWDTNVDQVKGYVNDTLINTLSGLGTWVGALSSTNSIIGAINTVPQNGWKGNLAFVGLYDQALSQSNIIRVARSLGVI